jgi:hypothetical protein
MPKKYRWLAREGEAEYSVLKGCSRASIDQLALLGPEEYVSTSYCHALGDLGQTNTGP